MSEETGAGARVAELEERLRSLELEYQRQRQDLRSAYEEIVALTALQEVTLGLLSVLEPGPLVERVVSAAVSLLDADGCALFLLLPESEELVVQVTTGQVGELVAGHRVRIGEGIVGWVAQTGEPAVVNDIPGHPRFSPVADGLSTGEIRSLLCMPLQFQGRLLGVLMAVNKAGSGPFEAPDLKRLRFLASVAAAMIERVRLYERLSEDRDRVLVAQEELRRRLARDLHDGPTQLVANIVMQIDYLRKLMAQEGRGVEEELDRLAALAQQAVHEMRVLLFDLRPIILETQGLAAAVRLFLERHRKETGPRLHVRLDESVGRYDAQVESSVFSIIQEAVNNALRHAEARNVWVRGEERGGQLIIDIEDDGKGFDPATVLQQYDERGSFGLMNMRERAEILGGRLTLVSVPGQGTTVTLRVPVGKRE